MTEKQPASGQEPFLLTLLPFAGLGLLLILALVWRVTPGNTVEPGEEETDVPSAEEMAATAISRWERAPRHEIPIDPARDFIRGPEDARITLVEFSDFECPFCKNAAGAAHDALEKYEGAIRLVFKNFPLDIACNDVLEEPMHRLACEAAVIARCAGEQDERSFWEVHNAIFKLPQLSPDALHRIPQDLGLDLEQLDACIGAPPAAEAVQADIALGRRLGVRGTPVFFVNGRRLSDYRANALEAVIEHVLSSED